jgi:hypothetical protein
VTHHIYLVPGFFGFANLGELRYFAHVRDILIDHSRRLGLAVRVHAVRTPPTASLPRRASHLGEVIAATAGRGDGPIHLIGHSSGGLDVRLLLSPGVSLPTRLDVERVASRTRTAVTVATPHRGTPLASLFMSVLGQRLLRLLSLSTIRVLRYGRLPLSLVLKLGAVFARVDRHLGVNSALLDQLFGQLLADFSVGRRRAIGRLFAEVSRDRTLLAQLTPEALDVFNAAARDRPGVRYGSVVARARPPGVRSTLAAGLDPTAQASHAFYQALHHLLAGATPIPSPALTRPQVRVLSRAYGTVPAITASDGMVPTLSQVWGNVVHATRGDHLDVIGHFDDPSHVPPHYDWLATGTGFARSDFEALWADVARYVAGPPPREHRRERHAASLRAAGKPHRPGRAASPRSAWQAICEGKTP